MHGVLEVFHTLKYVFEVLLAQAIGNVTDGMPQVAQMAIVDIYTFGDAPGCLHLIFELGNEDLQRVLIDSPSTVLAQLEQLPCHRLAVGQGGL